MLISNINNYQNQANINIRSKSVCNRNYNPNFTGVNIAAQSEKGMGKLEYALRVIITIDN